MYVCGGESVMNKERMAEIYNYSFTHGTGLKRVYSSQHFFPSDGCVL